MKSEEQVFEIIERLKGEKNAVILVEGKRDKRALKKVGVRSEIVRISQKNMYNITLRLIKKEKKIIILTDFDTEGTALFKKYRRELEFLGASIDTSYYRQLKFHLKKFIKGIEEIDTFLTTHRTSRPYPYNRE